MPLKPHIIVVLPFCNRDAHVMLKNIAWQQELLTEKMPEVVLSFDAVTSPSWIRQIEEHANPCYKIVRKFQYPQPVNCFPPNWAFRHTATHMARGGNPWLWMEADMIPLCPDWWTALQTEYDHAGKPFMGFVVHDLGHVNGTAIYPANTPALLANTLRINEGAWDVNCRDEMVPHTHEANHLIQHAWTIQDGQLHPYMGGQEPSFASAEMLRQILPSAVVFHRSKDGTLISRLKEARRKI